MARMLVIIPTEANTRINASTPPTMVATVRPRLRVNDRTASWITAGSRHRAVSRVSGPIAVASTRWPRMASAGAVRAAVMAGTSTATRPVARPRAKPRTAVDTWCRTTVSGTPMAAVYRPVTSEVAPAPRTTPSSAPMVATATPYPR